MRDYKISGRMIYQFRAYNLPSILEVEGIGLAEKAKKNMILWHCIVDKIVEDVLQSKLHDIKSAKPKPARTRILTPIEAIRFAAGFIIRKILTKYRKQGIYSDCIDSLVSLLLDHIGDDVDEEESYLNYTRI